MVNGAAIDRENKRKAKRFKVCPLAWANFEIKKPILILGGGAEAEWSKAKQYREKINEKQNRSQVFPLARANSKKERWDSKP